jgi:hypothetical protein
MVRPPEDAGYTMSLDWDKLYKLGTDVAGFALYHPTRLAHRKDDASG